MLILTLFFVFIFCLISYLYYNRVIKINLSFTSIYECGFINLTYSRLYFSIYIYIYILIFLILDLEIFVMSFLIYYNYKISMSTYIFIIFLLIIIIIEWYTKTLDWIKF